MRAKRIKPKEPLERFRWSSYGEYLKPARQRPGWLRADRLLGDLGIPKDSPAGRAEFARQMERRRQEESAADYAQVRGHWCLGSEEFREELLAAAASRIGPTHYGADRQETEEAKAQRWVREELGRLGWDEQELRRRPKGS